MSAGIYKKFLLIIFLSVVLPAVSYAQVSDIVFTTEPQTVKPGEVSGVITVQLQDSSGNSYKATETVDVEFLSPSASGEFLSPSSENPVTKTISTGSANKNFRYRDSTAGVFTLMVKAKGRTSLEEWSASQAITISNSSQTSDTAINATGTENIATVTTSSGSSSQNSSSATSAHYSAVPISSLKTTTELEVSAGRDRLGTAGSPLEFEVETNMENSRNSNFVWNFGDGSEAVGEVVNHTYMYPGEYIAVLNVIGLKSKAVSRANLKIVNPEFVITNISNEKIEITNNSKSESSLFGRALVTTDKVFAFPKDTIIKAGQKISFDADVTGLNFAEQSRATLEVVGTEIRPQEIILKVQEERQAEINRLSAELNILQNEFARLKAQEQSSHLSITPVPITEPAIEEVQNITEDVESQTETQTATVLQSVDAEVPDRQKESWLSTIKRFFLRTRE